MISNEAGTIPIIYIFRALIGLFVVGYIFRVMHELCQPVKVGKDLSCYDFCKNRGISSKLDNNLSKRFDDVS